MTFRIFQRSPLCAKCETKIRRLDLMLARYSYIGDRRAHLACARREEALRISQMIEAARNLVASARNLSAQP